MAKKEDMIGQIDEDIKNGTFANVYLLYGEETYLVRQYRDKLKNALLPEGDTMNYSYFEGKDTSAEEIIDLAETMPFFSDRRLLLLENTGFFKNSNDKMAEYIKTVPEATVMVFAEKEVDRRNRLYKAVKASGKALEAIPPGEDVLIRWIGQRLKKENITMKRQALQLFLSKTDANMELIDKELEKLICYTSGRSSIEEEDVEEICASQVTNQIFQMIEALSMQKQKQALDLYYDLLALKEAPMRILFLIARQFRILWQIREMQKKHVDMKIMASKLGIPEFVVRKNISQASRFQTEHLKMYVKECVELEEAVKTGRLNDRMAVEIILCNLPA